jgi:hypothetical protein
MDYFYDGQIRRYVTQFMRVFIGFKWRSGDGTLQTVPVSYGDMTRQVAAIIKDNSENKMPTVPKIACYITGLELDTSRLSDPSFVSKVNIRERRYTTDDDGNRDYQAVQGAGYTVERIMPTPFKLTMKADLWTSNTDQKLQLMEQILVLFNPSLEIQTTDNYIDWTSLSVLDIRNIGFSSRTIPAGAESEIDIASMEFEIPIWITPPAKVKKLGIVKSIIANVFTESGDVVDLENLVYNQENGDVKVTTDKFGILMFKSSNGQPYDYDITIIDADQAANSLGLEIITKTGEPIDWNSILDVNGGYRAGSQIFFKQPSGYDMVGTYAINSIDPTVLVVTFDEGTIPTNSIIEPVDAQNRRLSGASAGTIDAIIDPYKFNPLTSTNGRTTGIRYLMLDDVNPSQSVGDGFYDGPDAWKNLDGSDPVIKANSIIEWSGSAWISKWDPDTGEDPTYIQNLRTGVQYRWDGAQWLKSFEGEYSPGYWGFINDAC